MRRIHAFDFDGTVTTCDTLLAFIRFAKGDRAFLAGFLRYSPWLVLMKLGLYPNWKAKQRVFAHFFKGWTLTGFDACCRRFAATHAALLRPKAVEAIQAALAKGDTVVVVSASVDNRVAPFFRNLAGKEPMAVTVLGTRVETDGGVLTGRFVGNNCYGEEKVRRLRERFPDRGEYELVAYGDSRGDKELLAYADKGYFRPFE